MVCRRSLFSASYRHNSKTSSTASRWVALLVVLGVGAIALASGPAASLAQTYNTTGAPVLVQSLTMVAPEAPFGPLDFGYVDIRFVNGVERFGVPLEAQTLLLDEPLPPFLPNCTCEGFDQVVVDPFAGGRLFVAYYFSQPIAGSSVGSIHDGLLIRVSGDNLCVNAIRKTTHPVPVMSIFPNPDCMRRELSGPSPAVVRRLKSILEFRDVPSLDRNKPRWPEPFCLTCPPWQRYAADRAKFDRLHRQRVEAEVDRIATEPRTLGPRSVPHD